MVKPNSVFIAAHDLGSYGARHGAVPWARLSAPSSVVCLPCEQGFYFPRKRDGGPVLCRACLPLTHDGNSSGTIS